MTLEALKAIEAMAVRAEGPVRLAPETVLDLVRTARVNTIAGAVEERRDAMRAQHAESLGRIAAEAAAKGQMFVEVSTNVLARIARDLA